MIAIDTNVLVRLLTADSEAGLDFADAFHLALSQDHESLKTFDVDFIKRAKSLNDCAVEKP